PRLVRTRSSRKRRSTRSRATCPGDHISCIVRHTMQGETSSSPGRRAAWSSAPRVNPGRSLSMHGLLRDLQYAVRRLRSRIGFTLIAVISLGLGIGVNTAAFSLIDAIILRKTPIAHSERVAELDMLAQGQIEGPMAYPDLRDLRDQSASVFSQMSISQFTMFPRDAGDHVESLPGELVNGDFFPLIGLEPVVGRLLGPGDDVARGAHPVAVLGYNYWMSAFGGDRGVVGREVHLSGRAFTIVGVAPKAIEGLLPGLLPSVYVPMQMINTIEPSSFDQLTQRGNHSFFAKVRLADGASLASASAVVERFVGDMHRLHPEQWGPGASVRVTPLSKIAVNPVIDNVVVPAAAALMVVVGLVLIIACANLASFLLAQARDRARAGAAAPRRIAGGGTRRRCVRHRAVTARVARAAHGRSAHPAPDQPRCRSRPESAGVRDRHDGDRGRVVRIAAGAAGHATRRSGDAQEREYGRRRPAVLDAERPRGGADRGVVSPARD